MGLSEASADVVAPEPAKYAELGQAMAIYETHERPANLGSSGITAGCCSGRSSQLQSACPDWLFVYESGWLVAIGYPIGGNSLKSIAWCHSHQCQMTMVSVDTG